MQGKIMRMLLFLLLACPLLRVAAQEAPSRESLLTRMNEITNKVRTEMQQSPQAAVPLYDELSTMAENYFRNSHDYDLYLQVMSAVFQYYQWTQKSDSLVFIAARVHNNAVASGVQTLSLAAAKYMKAWAASAKGRQNETMRWLEAAYDAGHERAKTERDTYAFTLYAEMLNHLLQGYGIRGNYDRAMEIMEEAEPTTLQLYGRNSQQYLGLLMSKCELLYRLGRMDDLKVVALLTDSVFQQQENLDPQFAANVKAGIASMKQTLGMGAATEDDLKGNEALVKRQQMATAIQEGRLDEALQVIAQLLEIMEKQPITDIPSYAAYIQTAVNIHLARRSYMEALTLLEHAENAVDSLCKIDPYAGRKIEILHSTVLNSIGSNEEAMRHLQKAKQMYELAGDHSMEYYSECIFNLAAISMETGDYAYAKLYLDVFKQYFDGMSANSNPGDNETLQTVELTFANIYAMLGYKAEAIDKLEELLAKHEGERGTESLNPFRLFLSGLLLKDRQWSRARRTLSGMLTSQNMDMAQKQEMGLLICNASEQHPETAVTLKKYNQAAHDNIKAVMGAFSSLERQAFWESQANLLTYGHNTTLSLMPQTHDIVCQAYDNALYVKSMQDKQLHESSKWLDVARRLKADEVAVEFISLAHDFFDEYNMRFGALLLRNNGQGPEFVDLCPAEDVVQYFRDVIHTDTALINSLYAEHDSRLYRMLWQPLEPLLKGVSHVFYTPTGVLGLINHEALHDTDRRQLGERFKLHQLATTADIATVNHRQWTQPKKAVFYGGISYDESDEEMLEAAKPYSHKTDADAQLLMAKRSLTSRGAIDELEGTREEAVYASEVLKAAGCHTTLLTDQDANEESVKAMHLQAPELLHLGTHGFMLSTNQDQQQHRSLFEFAAVSGNSQQAMMLSCGLLMAGAYRAWRGQPVPEKVEDGILTAYELSQVDLTGCRLVVLSACETGHGFYKSTGDVGLKRALKLAGAEQIVVTLWEVSDNATSLLMRTFYDSIAAGQQPAQALATARNTVRSQFPQPYYWAGFVLVE
jgi:CHAT domain-containing protein